MLLFETIKEDFNIIFEKDPAIRSRFEIIFNYPGFWAIFFYRIANSLYKRKFRLIARIITGIAQVITNVDIHPAATIGRRVFIDHACGVVIGETCEIGNDVLIYQGVTLGGVSLNKGKRHPTIRDHVVVGGGAKVLGNIEIGEGSKIGANSVVVKDVPPESTAVGIPARIVQSGKCKVPLGHNRLPDVNKQIFEYLIKRVAILEHVISKSKLCDELELKMKDEELDEVYEAFIKSLKD